MAISMAQLRREARYLFNRYHNTSSPTEMLTDLNWEPLTTKRAKILAVHHFSCASSRKTRHYLVDICSPQYIHLEHHSEPGEPMT